MKIVILAGGTGSIALQTGLYNLLDKQIDGVDTKVIVNAYDNGLSTGSVRKVMNGKILGPSDVRKNQTTRLELENPSSEWLPFLNIRFTASSDMAKTYCRSRVDELADKMGVYADKKLKAFGFDFDDQAISKIALLQEAIDAYFSCPLAQKIDYNDFSLANIIYAGFAYANGNSLRTAARIMAAMMGIKDNVLLNDDTSLFLGAVTKSGKRISDEGDIVSWGNKEDPFVDVFFTDANGADSKPHLCTEAYEAIEEADLIILSSGTQWSSLIPTYASVGFKRAVASSKAEIVMVMNRMPDKDSPGQGASDIIRILTDNYFAKNRIRVVCDSSSHPIMRDLDNDALGRIKTINYTDLSLKVGEDSGKTHSPHALAVAVGAAYFGEYTYSDCYVFDYDDTLVGRGNVFPLSSLANNRNLAALNEMSGIKIAVCTGNSIKAISMQGFGQDNPLTVYADGGVNKYSFTSLTRQESISDDDKKHEFIECVNPSSVFDDTQVGDIIRSLRRHHVPLSKIENRGNALVTIKPVDEEYRGMVLELVKMAIKGPGIVVRASGRTTIEIARHDLSKVDAIVDLEKTLAPNYITYVGDELDSGNDSVVRGMPGVACLHVKNPVQTAFFTQILIELKRGAQ